MRAIKTFMVQNGNHLREVRGNNIPVGAKAIRPYRFAVLVQYLSANPLAFWWKLVCLHVLAKVLNSMCDQGSQICVSFGKGGLTG